MYYSDDYSMEHYYQFLPYGGDTVFGKIIRGESPARVIFEDQQCIAFYDICPQAPVHFLVVPKKPVPSLAATDDSDTLLLGHLMIVARRLAYQLNLCEGYRIVINNGPHAHQTVYHLHVHVLGDNGYDGHLVSWGQRSTF